MQIGTEHEYSINDQDFSPLPISDKIIEGISGSAEHEVPLGEVKISKELQKHALELIPSRPGSLSFLEGHLYRGLLDLYRITGHRYKFLGLGMHPLLRLDQTSFWDHEEQEYYHAYNRLFNIWQHGWLNIQALQLNLPYQREEVVPMFNRLRSMLPYLVAVSASSPFVEGKLAANMDSRLLYYRENQRRIPQICNCILPERLGSLEEYVQINREIYRELKGCGGEILCREWANSRGVIVRFSRHCLEIKAIDEQECLKSDMAIAALILALLRSDYPLEEDEGALRSLLEDAIRGGTDGIRLELTRLYEEAKKVATREEMLYLPLIARRIERGSLAELLAQRFRDGSEIRSMLKDMERALRQNIPYDTY
jgi:gamma-glutamyl:cysteine ligase YbdK (ATP-grasp superfamily)